MIDAKKLLDQFLGAGSAGSYGGGRYGSGPYGSGSGHGQHRHGTSGGGFMGDLQRNAGGILGGGGGGLASGALAGSLASVLLGSKSGRKLGKSAVTYGGMALVAGLAYRAYNDWQAKQAGKPLSHAPHADIEPPPRDTPFMPADGEADDRARLLVTAMISAAKADGYIDQDEQRRIFDRVGSLDLDAEAKGYLMDQLRSPLDLDGLVRAAGGRPEVALEIYAASLLAIDPDHPAEKAYLQMLAARLGLADALVAELHAAAEDARDAA